jgi:hypothetical protein
MELLIIVARRLLSVPPRTQHQNKSSTSRKAIADLLYFGRLHTSFHLGSYQKGVKKNQVTLSQSLNQLIMHPLCKTVRRENASRL